MTSPVAIRLNEIRLVMLLALLAARPGQAATLSCTQAAAVAEADTGIPAGLLQAIGVIESGRTDAAGVRAPWPFAIQSGGIGRYPSSADDAVATVRALQTANVQSIDIGCFQINLFHHPDAFPDLASGFDPLTNARVAAYFLVSLRKEFGAWEPAVAAYHSRVETLGAPYRDMILASWHGMPAPMLASKAEVGIRIWGPHGEIGAKAMPTSMLMSVAPQARGMWIRMPHIVPAPLR